MNVFSALSPWQLIGLQVLNILTRYFLVAGLAFLVFWKWLSPRLREKFLYSRAPEREDLRREIFYSVLSSFLFVWLVALFYGLKAAGIVLSSRMYFSVSERGWGWYGLSYLVLFLYHDAFFYWSHRLMHHPKLFRAVHRVHHLSTRPTPFAAYAFSPLEAAVQAIPFFALTFVVPLHWSVPVVFSLISLFFNVYQHLGFELLSQERREAFPFRYFAHPGHHSWHHQNVGGNYGFYLRFWDRAMGTWKGGKLAP